MNSLTSTIVSDLEKPTKQCFRCKRILPLTIEYFAKATTRFRGFATRCKRCCSEHGKKQYQKARLRSLIHYGGNPPCCACCKEERLEFLAIDHINGGGNRHRKEINRNLHTWLYRNNYPPGFRVLCHNCNFARGAYGYCPHENERLDENKSIEGFLDLVASHFS